MEGALNSGSFEDKMRTEWYLRNEYRNEQPLSASFSVLYSRAPGFTCDEEQARRITSPISPNLERTIK